MKIVKSSNQVLFDNVSVADTFFKRFKGLLGRTSIDNNEALVFKRCNCVHTIGMKTDIDLLFLDKEMKIIKVVHRLKPNRFSGQLNAKTIVEVASGVCSEKQIKPNDIVFFSN